MACHDLMNKKQHISRSLETYSSEEISRNRVRITASIILVRLLALHALPFGGHDERITSSNRGNFLEFLEVLAIYNEELATSKALAPKNAKYVCHSIQLEILNVISERVKTIIREEIGDSKYCVLVDEARDESKREQMSIVLRFVDKKGFIQERFFGVVHVPNTTSLTLRDAIYSVLAHHQLDISNIRGQGYDGASNMRGQYNGLRALILNDCKYAYYVHCFAHRLQLALMAAAKNVIPIHQFFDKLTLIVNIVGASCKRNDQLKEAHADNVAHLIAIGGLETGRGLNEVTNLQRAGETRWSSHLRSLKSLLRMFSAAVQILLNIMEDGIPNQQSSATTVYDDMAGFEFVFILHLMNEIMGTTDLLCQALQLKSQDIVNAMRLATTTKLCLQKLRDEKWDFLLTNVKSFCDRVNIEMPDLNAPYFKRGEARNQLNNITIEQHYRVDLFYAAIDAQLLEINERFSEDVMELLLLAWP